MIVNEQEGKGVALIAIGANLPTAYGNERETARALMEKLSGLGRIVARSKLYATEAVPAGNGPDYCNAALLLETEHAPGALLDAMHRIEAEAGRLRTDRWGARGADLDLIAYDRLISPNEERWRYWRDLPFEDQKIFAPDELILPHPRLQDRLFVLLPLKDIAPRWTHPVTGDSVDTMISAAPVMKIDPIDA
ncbi:2-amino-4-hydroxy-6-hydroxymethyldihydropteridine diphosphokinase [Paracoccaceae bacterium GXU_MW_L88]